VGLDLGKPDLRLRMGRGRRHDASDEGGKSEGESAETLHEASFMFEIDRRYGAAALNVQ
jgi:hypothetical protein